MTQSFDEWWEDNYMNLSADRTEAGDIYDLGAESRQAKVDELQKRIDEIENHVDVNYDDEREDDEHSYWSGYNQALRELNDILKGKEND